MFGNSQIGFLLLITHIASSITVGIILGLKDRFTNKQIHHRSLIITNEVCNFSNLGEVLSTSIKNAIISVTMIGGFIILFSVIISILEESHIIDIICNFINPIFKTLNLNTVLSKALISGIIELTNGINIAASIHDKMISNQIIMCSILLGFGGFSVFLQVLSITSKYDLSIKTYILGKFLQGIIAGFYTYIGIKYIPSLNLDLQPVSNLSNTLVSINLNISPIIIISLFAISILLFYILKKMKKAYLKFKINTIN